MEESSQKLSFGILNFLKGKRGLKSKLYLSQNLKHMPKKFLGNSFGPATTIVGHFSFSFSKCFFCQNVSLQNPIFLKFRSDIRLVRSTKHFSAGKMRRGLHIVGHIPCPLKYPK